MRNTFYDYDLTNYNDKQRADLVSEIRNLGFTEVYPEKGGGLDVARQILAHITIHQTEIGIGIVSNAAFELIKQISVRMYNWYKNNKPVNENAGVRPVINVDIHTVNYSKVQTINLYIDKTTSDEELKNIISKAENVDIIEGLYDYENNPPYKE